MDWFTAEIVFIATKVEIKISVALIYLNKKWIKKRAFA